MIKSEDPSMKESEYLINTLGWYLFEKTIPFSLLNRLRDDLDTVYEKRREIQIKNGIGNEMSGTCHHLLGENNSMDELITSLLLDDFIKNFFGGPYVLNSFGAFINQPNDTAYVSKIHKDIRTFSGDFRLLLNVLIMLDDFTLENGATYIFSGSHHLNEKPPEKIFYQHAARAIGKAGDVLVFNSNLWHAAGENTTHQVRRGLTLTFSRPFLKQQIDFPRFLSTEYASKLSEPVRQVLGYNARMPATLDEYYQPRELRTYKANQG